MRVMAKGRRLTGLATTAAVLLLSALCAAPAGAHELVEFEKEAALKGSGARRQRTDT